MRESFHLAPLLVDLFETQIAKFEVSRPSLELAHAVKASRFVEAGSGGLQVITNLLNILVTQSVIYKEVGGENSYRLLC
jgi:hypothetical protein